MNNTSSSSKIKYIIAGIVVALVLGGIATFTVVIMQAAGNNSLPSYTSKDPSKTLGTAENPYTIVEIVPDVDSALVGYLIDGQEPNSLLSIGATNKNDPDSAAGIYSAAFASETSPSSTVGDYKTESIFERDKDSIGTTPASGFTKKNDEYKDEGDPGTDKAYSELGYYIRVANGKGEYNYDDNKKAFVPVTGEGGGNFTWKRIGTFEYVGYGQGHCTRDMYNRSYSYNYDDSTGAVGSSAYKYYYTNAGDFRWVPNNNYNNENIYGENATEVSSRSIKEAVLGDAFLMTRTENEYYLYSASAITCNDLLVKNLVGDGSSKVNYVTQVVTVTPAQFRIDETLDSEQKRQSEELIDTADMFIIHDSATGYKIAGALKNKPVEDSNVPKFINQGDSKDLTKETMNRLIYRGAGANPAAIVFDEEAIMQANSYYPNTSQNCQYLKRLYDVYNNLGAKLAYNWMSGKQYDVKLDAAANEEGFRNFTFEEQDALGKSQFVYNYIGVDENGNASDAWLTNGFAFDGMIIKTDLNAPAFDNMGIKESGSSPFAQMSVAKMLSAINRESNAINQPKKLRILEIEPNEKYHYDANNKDSWVKYYLDLFPWFIGTSYNIEDDITVTKMPTYEFIGKNEDVNENYDLIMIGCKEQDATNGGNGYNDTNNLTWDEYNNVVNNHIAGQHGLWSYDGDMWHTLAYTAVGDLITTFGGDEMADAGIEDRDSDREKDYDKDYKWNYGLFKGNNNDRWYNCWNAPVLGQANDEWWQDGYYRYGFQRNFVINIVGGGDANGPNMWGIAGDKWWYQKDAKNKNFVYGTKHGTDANMIGLRYSGNDITKKKYDQLLDFSTQAPLVVADELYMDESSEFRDVANQFLVDQSSFVYKLANKNSEESSTVYKHARGADVEGKLNAIKSNLTLDTCYADFTPTLSGMDPLPLEYDEGAAINYNQQKNSSNQNVLEYHFVLNGSDDATYGVNVYTDSNGNGIFEGCINHEKERKDNGDNAEYDSERSSNLIIFDETSKANVNDGVLYNGHTYLVTRILPDSELGMVPWKLEIYKQGNESIRFSEEGYTRIKPASNTERIQIKVLQMNLSPDMTEDSNDSIVFANHYWYTLDYDWWDNPIPNAKAVNNQEMKNLLNVEDFNIQVDYMDNTYWSYVYGSNRDEWAKLLMNYDMLVIGFQDSARFTNNENYLYGFEKFREAGKSIILSHDLCQDATFGIMSKNDNWDAGKVIQADVRYYLRDISGQIRKYFDAPSGSNDYSYLDYKSNGRDLTFEPSDNFKIYTSVYEKTDLLNHNRDYLVQNSNDVANTPIYNKYTYTLGKFDDWHYTVDWDQSDSNGIWVTTPIQVIRDYYATHDHKPAGLIQDNSLRSMLYYNTANYKNYTWNDKIDRDTSKDRTDLVWKTETFATTKVQAVNDGQITKYPYAIPQTLDVAQTHMQNYQLDLEYDSDGDVLIWYNLAANNNGSIYNGRNQDSRNNFYIYTKGSITYTGLGHSGGMSDIEKKLFVNTMIAAYRSGAAEPYIMVTNPDAVNSGKTTTIYLEDREWEGSDSAITYRINDDTTNSKINRTYSIKVYKNGSDEPIEVIDSAAKATEYRIEPVSYSEVKSNNVVSYTIVLESSYKNDQGVTVTSTDQRTVNVALMPMFGLR